MFIVRPSRRRARAARRRLTREGFSRRKISKPFRPMKKYFHVIGIGLQNNLQYRVNYLTRTLFSFIPLFAMISLWRKIYEHRNGAASTFTEAEMMFYYLLVAVVDVLT